MSIKRDLEKLLRAVANTEGWEVQRRRSNHICVRTPEGVPLFMPSTPSEHRGLANNLAMLRRHGWKPGED